MEHPFPGASGTVLKEGAERRNQGEQEQGGISLEDLVMGVG